MNIKKISASLALIGTITSGVYFIDARYTLAAEHKKLVKRFDVRQLKDAKYDLLKNRRYWKKQLRENPSDQEAKAEVEDLTEQISDNKKELDALLKNK